MTHELRQFGPDTLADFLALMAAAGGDAAKCNCAAYCLRNWDQPGAGRAWREAQTRSDGWLLYEDGRAVGWCQCAPRAWFPSLVSKPAEKADGWAIMCMVLHPDVLGKGVAHQLFADVLAAVRRQGVPYVQAFAHRYEPGGEGLIELPEALCIRAGMKLEKDDAEFPVYGLLL